MIKQYYRLFNLYLSVFFILPFLLSGCTLSNLVKHSQNQSISIQPQPLEVTGENILFEVKTQIPRKVLREKATYAVELVYQYGTEQEDPVGRITFKPGEFVYEDNKPTIYRQFFLPYAPAKNPGQLLVQGVASTSKGRIKRTPWQVLATGIVTTSKLIVHHNQVNYAPDNLVLPEKDVKTLTFYFDKGETKLKNFFGNDLPVLNSFILANYKTDSVKITAGTSPEPEEFKDTRLGWQRAQTLLAYYKNNLEVNGDSNSSKTISFKTTSLPNSWDLFIKKIYNSALPEADKQKIMAIIYSSTNNIIRFDELSKLESADYLKSYVYPTLRFAEVQIAFTPQPKKDYEIYLLSKNIVENKADRETLTPEELCYAATLTPLLIEKQKIYEAAVATSDIWQAYHNLGIVYLELARQESRPFQQKALSEVAVKNLLYASPRQPTAENFYHLASAQQLSGNQAATLQSYDYALKAGGSTNLLQTIFADKAALHIQMGQIDQALSSLRYGGNSYQNYMNKGLCYLLKENYEQAPEFYEEALKIKPDDGLANYSLAIIAARTKDENLLGSYLKRAVQTDKSFIRKAIEDLEFKPYLKKEVFRSALKR